MTWRELRRRMTGYESSCQATTFADHRVPETWWPSRLTAYGPCVLPRSRLTPTKLGKNSGRRPLLPESRYGLTVITCSHVFFFQCCGDRSSIKSQRLRVNIRINVWSLGMTVTFKFDIDFFTGLLEIDAEGEVGDDFNTRYINFLDSSLDWHSTGVQTPYNGWLMSTLCPPNTGYWVNQPL